ncbi:MAG TPA: EAL domain-containing protein [Thermoanaerobaculia bacterium]|jgi:diguanylate cyclase (GGDEF)-like protein/PAS domain S-box-containing protein|nr:EAL domain-containing protein [Thermoanaerobaculia bacterium]
MTIPTDLAVSAVPRPSRFLRARRALARLVRQIHRGPGLSTDDLHTSHAILKAQQEATLEGILVVDPKGKILSYNRRFLEIWRIPDSVAATADDNELLGYAGNSVADWSSFIELVNHLYEHPDEVRTDDQVSLKDGRTVERASVPIIVDGQIRGRSWYFRDITEARKAEKLQSALFRIAQLSRESTSLDAFYAAVHGIVGELMNAKNFYIAEYQEETHRLFFPYFVDEYDQKVEWLNPGHGLTAYVLRTGQPLLATPEEFERLARAGEVENVGSPSIDWLGAPLRSGDVTWGVIGTQSYDVGARYTETDKEVLVFVSQHVAAAIEHKRREEALRASERLYRQMFENNRAVKLLIDPESGALVDVNMAACDYYGYTRDEMLALHVWDINVRGEEQVRMQLGRASSSERTYFQFRHMRASGEIRDVEIHTGPIEIGSRKLLFSIVHDITERKRAEKALQQSEEKYRVIFDYAPVGIYQSTRDGRLVTANATLARMLGYDSVEELLTKNLERDIYLDSRQRDELIRRFEPYAYANNVELQWRRKDGTAIWVQMNAHGVRSSHGSLFFEGFVYDVTERKQFEELLRKQSAAITASMDGIGILNERLEFTYVNDSLARLFGYGDHNLLIGSSLCDLYEPQEQVRFITTIVPLVETRGRWRGEATGLRRDGVNFPQEISLTSISGGGMVCVVRDITERTYAEEQIKHLAYHDALTNLPNRLLFKDRLTVALSHAQRENARLAVLFLDLDRFKVINDSLGHNIGDQLLQAVAARVHACVRDSDTVARLGGDEFTVLLPRLHRSDDAAPVAAKIIEAVRYPFHIEGREFFITTSIGISLFPEDGTDAESLIKNADTAMYQAKELGRDNYQLFNALVNANALQRIALEHGLRKAMASEELQVHYQPIFDLRSGRTTGMEALLRWTHPQLGPVPPATFIPLAEATGMMIPIGSWALRQACEQAKAWHDAGHHALTLAVNLSVTQLQQVDLVDRVRTILADTGFPAASLELEITESSAMQSPETSIRTLFELKKLGIRISLDDFGTGHSSLSYLKRFPIDTLKIDQSFVHDITSEPDTAAIVTAIIAMAHSLRLKVIAEGVEYPEQANFLRHHGCDQMQGYLMTPPVAAADFLQFVRGN